MRKIKTFSGRASLVLLLAVISFGAASAEVMTLDKCIETALENNSGMIAARNGYASSQGRVVNAWGDILPSLSIGIRNSRNWNWRSDGFDPVTLEPIMSAGTGYSSSGSIDLSQTYRGLGLHTFANIRSAQSQAQSSYYGMTGAQSNLVLQVKVDYYNILRAKMLMDVSQDAVKRGEERLRVAQSRYDLGSASMSDVLKAKVQFGSDKLDLVQKTNAYRLALVSLAFTMGVDVNREFDVEEGLPSRQVAIEYNTALNEALAKNSDYRQSQFNLETSKYGARMAFANLLPSVTVGLSHGTNVPRLADMIDFRSRDANWSAFVSLNFNIFNNFFDYSNIRSARREVSTQQENVANTRNGVAMEIKQGFLDLEQADEARRLSDESVGSAQEDVNLVREKYNLGAATILEVLDAEVSLKEAQTNQVQALYDYNLAISRLEKAMGR